MASSAMKCRNSAFSIGPLNTRVHRARRLINWKARSVSTLSVDRDRLMQDLHHTCQWGPGARWGEQSTDVGMSRPTLSDADKQARDWFDQTTRELGCKVSVDEMGNQFAIKPGKKEGPPTAVGSHLDTQPTGGRYDGILGIHAGIEMLKVLKAAQYPTEYPIAVVNWTNEEGARFPISMVSSGVWGGAIPLEKAHTLPSVVRTDAPHTTMLSELKRIGYHGTVPCSHENMPLAAHFELHIEQGPILEANGQRVGIVEGVQAYRWYTITINGRDCHSGTTDLHNRADALLGASKMIARSRQVAWEMGALASTGIIEAKPGSTNTVPGHVTFSLDIRAKANQTVLDVEETLQREFESIAAGEVQSQAPNVCPADKLSVQWSLDSDSKAVYFHQDCIQCVTEATKDMFGADADKLTRPMVSGAGHDSVYTSRKVPTSMIFIPSRDGISHNSAEYSSPEDCATGAQAILLSVVAYDKLRQQRGA